MSGQNTSHAVMAQRAEPHDSLDDFPTQPWATRALMEHVLDIPRDELRRMSCWEPACNRGHMAMPLMDYFGTVFASDIHDYGWGGQEQVWDFLFPDVRRMARNHDWIITNPPFRLAEQFVRRALELQPAGVAIIARTQFLEGVGRYHRLFRDTPPTIVAQFTERVPMVKGRLTATGSTATAYCWLVWRTEESGPPRFMWIPPCRRGLERPGDYEA